MGDQEIPLNSLWGEVGVGDDAIIQAIWKLRVDVVHHASSVAVNSVLALQAADQSIDYF